MAVDGRYDFVVDIPRVDMIGYAPDLTQPDALVVESFRFLLEREAPTSIMPRFALPVIERYFPEYESEIRLRLSRSS